MQIVYEIIVLCRIQCEYNSNKNNKIVKQTANRKQNCLMSGAVLEWFRESFICVTQFEFCSERAGLNAKYLVTIVYTITCDVR